MACYSSTPFSILPILKGPSRVIFSNFLNAYYKYYNSHEINQIIECFKIHNLSQTS